MKAYLCMVDIRRRPWRDERVVVVVGEREEGEQRDPLNIVAVWLR